jgi:cyclic pyranopterin phosphate synthase
MLRDSLGRSITYLRISVTDRCNYRCRYCMPPGGIPWKPHGEILSLEHLADVAVTAGRLGMRKVKFTGGEPLVRKNIEHLIGLVADSGWYTDVGLTTNGALLTKDKAVALRSSGLQRVNISLDSLDPQRFWTITRGGRIDDVLHGIEAAHTAGFAPIKINMIIFDDTQPGEIESMNFFCKRNGLVLQTIRHFSLLDRQCGTSLNAGEDRPPRCAACNRLRLTADGCLKSCLFSDEEVPLDLHDIETSILKAITDKPASGRSCTTRTMSQIGG